MAALTQQKSSFTGTTVTLAAASGGGDTCPVGSVLLVNNASGSSINVTVTSVDKCNQGVLHDLVVAVGAGAQKSIGPLTSRFANASDGLVHVGYSAVTSVTVAAID